MQHVPTITVLRIRSALLCFAPHTPYLSVQNRTEHHRDRYSRTLDGFTSRSTDPGARSRVILHCPPFLHPVSLCQAVPLSQPAGVHANPRERGGMPCRMHDAGFEPACTPMHRGQAAPRGWLSVCRITPALPTGLDVPGDSPWHRRSRRCT